VLAGCDGGNAQGNNTASFDAVPIQSGEGVFCPAVEQRVSPGDCEDLNRADAEVRPGAAAFNVPDPMRRGETFEVHLVIDRRSPMAIRVIEEPLAAEPAVDPALDTASNAAASTDDPSLTGTGSGEDPTTGASPTSGGAPPSVGQAPAMEDQAPTPGQIVDGLPGTAERFFPPTGRHMRAELVGDGFGIRAETEASQQIPLGGQASWVWSVTAKKGGTRALTLITVVEGVVEGRRFVLARTPRVKTVNVEVSLRDRLWDGFAGAPDWIKSVTAVLVALGGLLTAWYALPWGRRRRAARAAAPDKEADGSRAEEEWGGTADR
jgi:hypothetical protein